MFNSGIQINKYVKKWLTSSEDLLAKVEKKNMQPLMVNPTERPIITWMHGPVEPDYSKAPDGLTFDNVEVAILIVSNDYEESLDIAEIVRNLLELHSYEDEDIRIPIIQIEEITEEVLNDSYVQRIIMQFTVQCKDNR